MIKKCVFCELIKQNKLDHLIVENEHALAIAESYFREGHCTVILKRHILSISEIKSNEYNSIFELITKISMALEKHYKNKKTYLLSIGDQVEHLHFHLIPKHKNLCSMGVYCFQSLFETEGECKPSDSEKKELANSIKALIR